MKRASRVDISTGAAPPSDKRSENGGAPERRRVRGRFAPGNRESTGRPAGCENTTTREIRELARAILEQPEALAILMKQARAGTLHPVIHRELMHYAYGKPKETLAIEGGLEVLRVVIEQ